MYDIKVSKYKIGLSATFGVEPTSKEYQGIIKAVI